VAGVVSVNRLTTRDTKMNKLIRHCLRRIVREGLLVAEKGVLDAILCGDEKRVLAACRDFFATAYAYNLCHNGGRWYIDRPIPDILWPDLQPLVFRLGKHLHRLGEHRPSATVNDLVEAIFACDWPAEE
jgi:hypothetical protein